MNDQVSSVRDCSAVARSVILAVSIYMRGWCCGCRGRLVGVVIRLRAGTFKAETIWGETPLREWRRCQRLDAIIPPDSEPHQLTELWTATFLMHESVSGF
jgi:hypothetical protein